MKISKLHYITNGSDAKEILHEIQTVVNAGVDWVQLRIKNKDLDFLSIAIKAQEICKGKATFIINDKVSVAKQINADGVHLGLTDLPIQEARKILGKNKIIGGTANTLQDCLNHQANTANYIGLGPYKKTSTKKKLSPLLGINGCQIILPKTNGKITIPVLAIGGIQLNDIPLLKEKTGIYGVAVSGLIANSKNKKETIDKIETILT